MSDSYDSPWKEALHVYFPQFLELLFPEVHQAIDWGRGWRVLDNELLGSAATTARRVDVLMEVTRLDGEASCILVHVEVQNQHEAGFSARLFDYHYRIRLHFGKPVCTLVVLGDPSRAWRPDSHEEELLGCRHRLEFPTVKLEELRPVIRELEANKNPFGPVVAAHLHVRSAGPDSPKRQRIKQRLVRQLYKTGFTREQVRQLFNPGGA
ncbi:MAG: hypothetical protein AB7S38_15180 [Vulcanimicrobiota bacterium]